MHYGVIIDSHLNFIGMILDFVQLMDRENHIKAKYKLKAWVVHNSSPAFTDYSQAELKILNERGFGYRSTGQPPARLRSSSNRSSRMAAAFDSIISGESTPDKPSVRLPPQHASSPKPVNNIPMIESKISSPEPVGAVPTEKKLMSLPGVGWSMKWKEQTGIDSLSVDETDSSATEEAEKQIMLFKDVQKSHSLENCPPKTNSMALSPASSGKMHYRINIPPLTKWQQNLSTYPRYSSRFPRAPMMNQGTLGHPHYISASRPAIVSIPFQGTVRSQMQSAPPGPKPLPAELLSQQEPNSGYIPSIRNSSNPSAEQQKSTIDHACDGLVPILESFDGQGMQVTTSTAFGSQSLLDAPIFPFPRTTDMHTFSFHPMLPHTPSNPFFGDSTVNLLDASQTQGVTSHLTTLATATATLQKQFTESALKAHTPCYDWNYYFECSEMKDGECQKMHICEICALSEHRAAQHWHHLATAPLPEIQIQPKLSTPTGPPDSPTLSAVRDRVRLFVPPSSVNFSDSFPKDLRDPLFGQPLGLEGSQKAAAQSERLKRRKLQSRNKTTTSTDVCTSQSEDGTEKDAPLSKHQLTAIITPATSTFEKPVEVILPPAVRPFRSTNMASNPPTRDNSPSGKLRVTAPVFEPSHAGAWIPFSSPTNQFRSLFQIPSKDKKNIEIVAPKKKEKEVARDTESEIVKVKKTANNREYNTNPHKGEGQKVRTEYTKSKIEPGEPSRGKACKETLGSSSMHQPLDTFSDIDWNAPGPSTPSPASAATAMYFRNLSRTPSSLRRAYQAIASSRTAPLSAISHASFQSDALENNVLKILDEQLEATIRKESPETIAATLQTIIEICSTKSTQTSPQDGTQFDFSATAPTTSNSHSRIWPWHEAENSNAQINFFTLSDFADEETFCPQSHADAERPRSSDSSSTAPLSSPESPKNMTDQTPLKGRIERIMSCTASNGTGQCNCGLGDWFHHSQV